MNTGGDAKWSWGGLPPDSGAAVPASTGTATPTNPSQPSTQSLDDDDVLRARVEQAVGGEYVIHEELGRGGMAVVFRAVERSKGRVVAIKVIRGDQLRDPESRARFEREAAMTGEFDSPDLVRTLAVREVPPRGMALVMEYMSGGTLKERVKREGPLPIDDVIAIITDIARGLSYAHARGVVHRDLKPENVFLMNDGITAKIGDFGIARATAADTLTLTGTVIGTPAYMSPEQIDGRRVDHRSDLYSFGLITWEVLTGKQPWQGETLFSTIHKQKLEALPLATEARDDIPPELDGVLRRCLAKDPLARPESAGAVLKALSGQGDDAGSEADDPEVGDTPVPFLDATNATMRWRPETGDRDGADVALAPSADPSPQSARRPASQSGRSAGILGVVVSLSVIFAIGVWAIAAMNAPSRPTPASDSAAVGRGYVPTAPAPSVLVAPDIPAAAAQPLLMEARIVANDQAAFAIRSARGDAVVAYGNGRVLTAQLEPGDYRVRASSRYGGDVEHAFSITSHAGANVELVFPLEGTLAIAASDGWPVVVLDDRELGETPLEVPTVPTGPHRLVARWPDGRVATATVEVFGARTTNVNLTPP